jgi:hypothetical protein
LFALVNPLFTEINELGQEQQQYIDVEVVNLVDAFSSILFRLWRGRYYRLEGMHKWLALP